jgi:hypothetical protein
VIRKSVGRLFWKRRVFMAKPSIILALIMWSASSVLLSQGFQSLKTPETSVKIHTEDARATLIALRNPNLTLEEASSIARMHGNQGVIHKLQEFGIASTTESFASALYAAAHGRQVTTVPEIAIGLDRVKPKSPGLLALLDEIEASPKIFRGAIEDRIRLFTPANADLNLDGYIVAAGDGAGYAFGGTDFFLNIGIADDMLVAKSTTTHELYHAVQAAYAPRRKRTFGDAQGSSQGVCANEQRLFGSLYEEGTARLVEETTMLTQSKSEGAFRIVTDFKDGITHLHAGVTLLDMSVDALEATNRLAYEDVYEVGFLGHGVLYGAGYVMARDIASDSGRQAIVDLLKEPPDMFVLRYTQLAKYGLDDDHPALGKSAVAAAQRLAAGCR